MSPHANGKPAKSDPIGDELAKHRHRRPVPQPEYAGDHVLDSAEDQGFTPEELAQIAEWEVSAPATSHSHFETLTKQSLGSLPLLYYADISPALDAADFVEGLLIEGAMSVIYGESGCGKTFFALDLALHVAAGLPWRSREVDRGGVLYLALEGSHGIKNRIAAFKTANCAGDADLPFAVVPVSVNLLDPNADTENVIAAAKAAAAKFDVPIKLIVVDTLSRALAGGNENDPKDMGALVRNVDYIRQQLPAHVAIVHHSGKDSAKGARGHSLLRAATDTEIEVTRDPTGKISTARVTKQRELDCDGEFAFRLESVSLGTNRRGKSVCSCVVRAVDAEDLAAQAERRAAEKAAEAAERQAADAAKKVRAKEEAAASRLADDAEKVLRAIKRICDSVPGASKNRIRAIAGLNDPRAVAAIAKLLETGTIETCEYLQASGKGGCNTVEGYRPTELAGLAGTLAGQNSCLGNDPGIAGTEGDCPDKEWPDRGSPLKGDPSGSPANPRPHPGDFAKRPEGSPPSIPSEGEDGNKPRNSPDAPAPRKAKRRQAASAKPRLFAPMEGLPD